MLQGRSFLVVFLVGMVDASCIIPRFVMIYIIERERERERELTVDTCEFIVHGDDKDKRSMWV